MAKPRKRKRNQPKGSLVGWAPTTQEECLKTGGTWIDNDGKGVCVRIPKVRNEPAAISLVWRNYPCKERPIVIFLNPAIDPLPMAARKKQG